MTDHLPECIEYPIPDFNNGVWLCICPALRACEQRVEREWIEHCNRVEQRVRDESWDHGMEVGTHSALDAAREAVAAMPPMEGWKTRPVGRVDLVDKWSALAAIDALRGER